jgi:aspartate 1-decarboxylase
MQFTFLKSKIHRAIITHKNLNYEGSIEIDSELMNAAGFHPYEQVQVLNLENANRFTTYIIPAEVGSGRIALAGPAARLGEIGDLVIIISYALLSENEIEQYKPKVVLVDKDNHIKKIL